MTTRVAGTDRKVAQGILARSDRVDTHLIPEVRPYRANALRCSKTLPAFLSLRGTLCSPVPATRVLYFSAACKAGIFPAFAI